MTPIQKFAFGLSLLISAPLLANVDSASTRIQQAVESSLMQSLMPVFNLGVENPNQIQEGMFPVVERSYFRPSAEVLGRLHAEVEAETDVVYIVNTSDMATSCSGLQNLRIPNQHMVLLKRNNPQTPLFTRDGEGKITGLNPAGVQVAALTRSADGGVDHKSEPQFRTLGDLNSNSETAFIPVSTGTPGGSKILTYSGIFRVNERRTNDRRKSTNTAADPMQWSVYIDGEYSGGMEARLALHGTSTNYWHLLGKSRASSGCIRLQSDFSHWNQQFLFSKESDGQLAPREEFFGPVRIWSRQEQYPPAQFSSLPTGRKLKVLIVFFDGVSNTCT